MPKSEDDIDLDGVLNEIGQFGRFQVRQYGLMIIPIIFNALFTLSYVFTAGNLDYRCKIPECDDTVTSYHPAWLNNSVPFKNGVPAQCERFRLIANTSLEDFYCDADAFDRSTLAECSDFVYADDEVTIVKDFNINCPHNDWKLTLVGTVNNIGQFIALPIAGYLSDRFGRRLVLLLSVAGSAVFGILRSYATSYEMFIIMEFLDPAIGSTMYTTAFVLALELVGPKMRVSGNNVISCAFSFGEAALALFAMFFRNWRVLLKIIYIPGLVSLPLLWMTSESVRWLLSKGDREKAFGILKKAAKMNGKSLSPAAIESFYPNSEKDSASEELGNAGFFSLLVDAFRSPGLLLRVANCSFCWLTNVLVYYGLSLNSVTLAGDKYLNFILVSLIELPGFLIMQLILDRVGRRATLCTTMLLCGLFCLLAEFIPTENTWLSLIMFLVSKMAITMSFGTLYIYTVEIFPTNLRQSLLSVCSMFGRIGSMIAPQTPLLAKLWSPLPMVIFGGMGITSGLAILQFPETLNIQLPNTVQEAMSMNTDDRNNKDRDQLS
ncbi:organic cation transporter protein-like [Topomyia yanbarensis]|uniref:organic cation transporter protein-like n=1 Tax=Topomyia yanbarensis TaxID=2498891 RepID=UPI00273CD4FF|nr:organic cation transporter protein-like [Topomyia yanbarensis]